MLDGIENFHKNPYFRISKTCTFNVQNTKKQNSIAFCGLKRQFEKQVYFEYKTLQTLYNVNIDNKAIVGKPPQEIVNAIKTKTASGSNSSENIKKFMGAFSLASNELIKAETRSLKYIDDFDLDRYICNFIVHSDNHKLDDIISAFTPYFGVNRMPDNERQEYEQLAAKHIEQTAKDIGILSKDDTVEVKYIGIGSFGTVYNVSFKDKDGEKIFHDKALKVYRDKDNDFKARKALFEKLKSFCESITADEFCEKYSTSIKNILVSYNKKDSRKVYSHYKDVLLNLDKILRKFYDTINSATSDNFEEAFNEGYYSSMNIHGCFAEANRAVFLNNSICHIKTSDFIEPYFFNLNSGFGLFEKADSDLPEVKTVVDLSKLNLEHGDLSDKNEHNKVCGRIVDYGGIRDKDYLGHLFNNMLIGHEVSDKAKTIQASKED